MAGRLATILRRHWMRAFQLASLCLVALSGCTPAAPGGAQSRSATAGDWRMVEPSGDTYWPGGGLPVRWTGGAPDARVSLVLSNEGALARRIATDAPNTGERGWLLPPDLDATARYHVALLVDGQTVAQSGAFRVDVPTVAACFPVGPNTRWAYQSDDGTEVEVRVAEGEPAPPGEVQLRDSTGREERYLVTDAGLFLQRVRLPDGDQQWTFEPPLQIAPARLEVGARVATGGAVQIDAPGSDATAEPVAYKAVFSVDGYPTLRVPAGEFACVKVTGVLFIGPDERFLLSAWLADGIGMVQRTGDLGRQLVSFTPAPPA